MGYDIWRDPDGGIGSPGVHQGVERHANLGYDDFVSWYTRGNRPVLITDVTKDWSAMRKWSPRFLKEHYGSLQITVDKAKVRLGDFMDEVNASNPDKPGRYAYSLSIEDLPGLAEDIVPHPKYWSPNWLDSPYLLPFLKNHHLKGVSGIEINIGGAGSAFPQIHYDELDTETFIVQVYGRKEWVLYPPEDTPYMYKKGPASTFSLVPFMNGVDLEKYPLFRSAKPVRFIIEPGEMFYNPPKWWHTTRALTPSIAVVYTIARGPIWWSVTKASCLSTIHTDERSRPVVYAKAAAILTYMTGFRIVRSVLDAFSRRA